MTTKYVMVKRYDLVNWANDWAAENDPGDDTDCVTPFDAYLLKPPVNAQSTVHVEVLRHMKGTIKAIMPSEVAALDAAIAALSASQPPAEAQSVGEVRMYSGLLYARLDGDFPVGTKLYVHPPSSEPEAQGGGDGMLPDALVPHADEWYRLCERRFAVDRIIISGKLAEAIVAAVCARPDTAPPSVPVGVEAKVLARDVHYAIRDAGLAPESPADDAATRDAILAVIAQQPAATLPDVDDDDLTVAYMAGRHDGRKDARQPAAVNGLIAWRAAFIAERATRYRERGMTIEQARIHAETDAARIAAQPGGSDNVR